MNKNTQIISSVAAVLLAVAIVLLVIFIKKAPETTPTTTPDKTEVEPAGASAPVAVTNASVTPSDIDAAVTGTVNPNGLTTNYWFEYGTTPTLGEKTNFEVILGSTGFKTVAAPGYLHKLTKNTTYFYRIVAENKYGKVPGQQYSFKTLAGEPQPPTTAPMAITNAAGSITKTNATLKGKITPNYSATSYWFEYGQTLDLGKKSTATAIPLIVDNKTTSVTLALTGLDPATKYYFSVVGQNAKGITRGEILSFKTSGPANPSAPIVQTKDATGVAKTSVQLAGTVDPRSSATTYWFEYSTDSLLGNVLLHTTTQKSAGSGYDAKTETAYVDSLNPGTTYYYRIAAQNAYGIVRGDKESFKTLPQ